MSISVFPCEANPPLIVDPDAVLSFPIASQSLEAIARWNSQIPECFSRVEHQEFPQCDPLYIRV